MFNPWVRKIPWRRKWQPTPVFLPGESHGQRSLVGYSLWDCKESDTTEITSHTLYHDSYSKYWEANQGGTVTGKGLKNSQIGESKKVSLKWWHLTFKLSAKTRWVRWCYRHVRKPGAGKNHPGPSAKWWNWTSSFQLILLTLKFYQEQTQIISRYIGKWNGEGNGNPLQYSCLEKPMDGGAW